MSYILTDKVKLTLCLTKHYAMKTYGGVDVYIHVFLTLAQVGDEWSASCLCRFTSGKEPSVPIKLEAGWATKPVWMIGEMKVLDPTRTRTPTSQLFSP
jgi:hypothetical protein